MKDLIAALKRFIIERFSLDEDKAEETRIVESVEKNIHFRGTNLWTLIFAILIACIGLNVNSYAMLIGAMLISPLMGPIMGIGLGIGILDFDLMKKGMKNLVIATMLSVLTSYLYFLLTPLQDTNAELLARTTPSIWDVLVAFFGGMAGIIAGTRKEKSNVLPGVAIATALLPPLCTVGFGIATGQWTFILGAFYLFFVNGVFICLATFIIVRYLKFRTKVFADRGQQKRVTRYIWLISVLTLIPSVFLAFRIVQKTIFEQNARRFVLHELNSETTQVIHQSFRYNADKPVIDLLLLGEQMDATAISKLKSKMGAYNLDSTWLELHQGLDANREIDLAQIRASLLQDVLASSGSDRDSASGTSKNPIRSQDLRPELKALYPEMKSYSLAESVIRSMDTTRLDTVTLFIGNTAKPFSDPEKTKLREWLKYRTGADSVEVLLRP
ncbi:MAG: TIGR00341 family protein [Chitinophagaceae bacterium]|nr:MAG: TIGR00341 family protein [Chitinophagaceae bacterium]